MTDFIIRFLICLLSAVLLLSLAPVLPVCATNDEIYHFDKMEKNISYLDLSEEFAGYNGSFVLYDDSLENWQIYNINTASKRTQPDSTYKIYSLARMHFKTILKKYNTGTNRSEAVLSGKTLAYGNNYTGGSKSLPQTVDKGRDVPDIPTLLSK